MKLNFGQVEELVAGMLQVDASQRTKLIGRFKQLKRLGFPPGVNIKTGRFAYDMDATNRCVLAFTLMNALLPTRAAVELLSDNWGDIGHEVATILGSLDAADGRINLSQRPEDGKFIIITTGKLETWSGRGAYDGEDRSAGETSHCVSLRTKREIEHGSAPTGGAVPPSRLIVDLWTTVAWSADFLLEKGWVTLSQLAESS